uniref:GTP pyrophosphokinase n=1 Tax=Ndongobacter massiliensis TaxID=1871025 RepID=UPI0009300F35|nr:hypothetical protein [Ndongobacter massiliensis]
MFKLKLKEFVFIDEVIAYKHALRFSLSEAQSELDHFFLSIFRDDDHFVNYTSRIKEDESLKEKLIRRNYMRRFDNAEAVFDSISDILGCRIECRFIDDEAVVFRQLLRYFPKERENGYFRSDRDPRIELNLHAPQPARQQNGFHSYRIDGRFFGDRVFNFELQIKSIVNLFWNEIDHKILYKNYNYIVSEQFVREIMDSIRGNLSIIDRQMQMVQNHLRRLESDGLTDPGQQIRTMIGRILQDAYIVKLRDIDGIRLDFRKPTVLLTDYLFAKVQYESREEYAAEFVRLMEGAMHVDYREMHFGERISFEQSIHYAGTSVAKLGKKLEEEVNEGLLWNIIVHILLGLNAHRRPEEELRTFVDYLYFRIIHSVRTCVHRCGRPEKESDFLTERITDRVVDLLCNDFLPEHFTECELANLQKTLAGPLAAWESGRAPAEAVISYLSPTTLFLFEERNLDESSL